MKEMRKIDWKAKLTSRKFWVAVASLVTGVVLMCTENTSTAQTIGGCVMSAAAVIAYIVGEGLTDAAAVKTGEDKASEDRDLTDGEK